MTSGHIFCWDVRYLLHFTSLTKFPFISGRTITRKFRCLIVAWATILTWIRLALIDVLIAALTFESVCTHAFVSVWFIVAGPWVHSARPGTTFIYICISNRFQLRVCSWFGNATYMALLRHLRLGLVWSILSFPARRKRPIALFTVCSPLRAGGLTGREVIEVLLKPPYTVNGVSDRIFAR